ncbi:hypothetical protein BH23VER1_BH23VER1_29940 [soil metagenome]
MKTTTRPFDIRILGDDGRLLTVETIQVEVYQNFGEEILTPESTMNIERVRARHMGIMHGDAIRAMRQRLGLSQKQLTDLIGCGDKSLSRWENGHAYPTGPINTLLRLLDEGFLAPASLTAVRGARSEIASERYLRKRDSNIIHPNFKQAPAPTSERQLFGLAVHS